VTFDEFLPHVLPSVEGCPDAVALVHVRNAARDFCRRTLVWQYATNPIAAEAGKGDYTLQIASDREPVRVLLIDVDGVKYTVPASDYGRAAVRRGWGNYALMLGPFDFRLSPVPTVEGAPIVVDIAVKPRLDSDYWPDDLADHVIDIAHGAIASLALVPRKEWTDLNLAATERGLFMDRASTIAAKVSLGRGRDGFRPTVRFI